MATASVTPVATFPKASSARTFTAGLIWRFATVVPGCVPNTSSGAPPGVIVNPPLGAGIRPGAATPLGFGTRSEEHTPELQSQSNLGCRLLLGTNNLTLT